MKQQDQVEVKDIYHDPMIAGILNRLPEKVAATFSEEQLLCLKAALGAQRGHRHPFDVRSSFGLGRLRWYYVFLAGRDRRASRRREGRCNRLALLLFWFFFLVVSLVLGVLVLVGLKWGPGIDLLALRTGLLSNFTEIPVAMVGWVGWTGGLGAAT